MGHKIVPSEFGIGRIGTFAISGVGQQFGFLVHDTKLGFLSGRKLRLRLWNHCTTISFALSHKLMRIGTVAFLSQGKSRRISRTSGDNVMATSSDLEANTMHIRSHDHSQQRCSMHLREWMRCQWHPKEITLS